MINRINWFHFLETPLLVHLRDVQYGDEFLVEAHPDSCLDGSVSCRWPDRAPLKAQPFEILNLVIPDGLKIVLIPVTDVLLSDMSFSACLPERGFAFGKRKVKRYPASAGIRAEISQSGFNAQGVLLDFNSLTFRIEAGTEAPDSYHWFDPAKNILVRLSDEKEIVFQGICRCVRQTMGTRKREIVVSALGENSPAVKGKRKRSPRRCLRPAAFLTFRHPLSGEIIQRDIESISMTGFSVRENGEDGVLLPGMVLPEATIRFYGSTLISFRSRVVHRLNHSQRSLCGLAFLDMDMQNVRHLTYILANISDPHLFIARQPDMEALWDFLFQTGFLYPKKYEMIKEHRESLKETFRKLYCLHPDIADHFLYQKDGKIYGHLSMVRAYERGWVLHHLAALRMGSMRVALALLKQAVEYFEGIHRFPSMRMDYLIFYYRPENRFPNLIGEFAKSLNNPKGCSQDLFAYLEIRSSESMSASLPAGWSLELFSREHRSALEQYYEHASGGLLMDVLLEDPDEEKEPEIEAAYLRYGMKRRIQAFSLVHDGRLKAVLWQNESDLGLNLSELLNAIKIVVVDPQHLSWMTLKAAIGELAAAYAMEHVPVLLFPASYLSEQEIRPDKNYMMWIMDVQYGRTYIEYMETRIRRSKRLIMLLGWLRKVLKRS